ncbi:MAG TPA: hypothetical protein H9746_00475 [Candidatus Butyricicoccus avistercoris]|uniref:Uncharacterized protein n=1 Tax=Candidatus Butyricicoccus avistercoris TaxID=2838518 RepID=A0A9D1THH3_9FIRM|nr:hypothetical protein [Candidatus Butyricicoccus avistercoris]
MEHMMLEILLVGDALRTVQENLDAKNYYAYNPEFDVQPVPQPRNMPRI